MLAIRAPLAAKVSTPSPIQTGMVTNCNDFYKVNGGDSCYILSHDKEIDLNDFYDWNPAVKSDCSGLQANVYVCVGTGEASTPSTTSVPSTTSSADTVTTPTPNQRGMIEDCNEFYKVRNGDGCWAIAEDLGISGEDIIKWNPAARSDCTGLLPGYYICVGAQTETKRAAGGGDSSKPSHKPSGEADSCKTYYRVKSGDGCYNIAQEHQISLDDFLKWNKNINSACTNLQPDAYVCVGV